MSHLPDVLKAGSRATGWRKISGVKQRTDLPQTGLAARLPSQFTVVSHNVIARPEAVGVGRLRGDSAALGHDSVCFVTERKESALYQKDARIGLVNRERRGPQIE